MRKRLAIKGHFTRGKEVIELLEMMGGVNGKINKRTGKAYNIYNGNYFISEICNVREVAYYIDFESKIRCIDIKDITTHFIVYSLEMFLETFPFKVDDRVIDKADGCPGVVCEMKWDEDVSDMKYCVAFGNGIDFGWFANDSIEFCKENKPLFKPGDVVKLKGCPDKNLFWIVMDVIKDGYIFNDGKKYSFDDQHHYEKSNREVINPMKNVLAELLEHIKTTPKEDLEREFKGIEEWSSVGPTVEEFMDFCDKVNKKQTYPNDYEECVRIAKNIHGYDIHIDAPAYRGLMESFIKLLICRDAYWKIAGEEMGLDKSWESPLPSLFETVYCIRRKNNIIIKGSYRGGKSEILEFPTEEMRDVFYENFKELIEQCKELL